MNLSEISRSAQHHLDHENGNGIKGATSDFFSNLGHNLKSAYEHFNHSEAAPLHTNGHSEFLSNVSQHARNYLSETSSNTMILEINKNAVIEESKSFISTDKLASLGLLGAAGIAYHYYGHPHADISNELDTKKDKLTESGDIQESAASSKDDSISAATLAAGALGAGYLGYEATEPLIPSLGDNPAFHSIGNKLVTFATGASAVGGGIGGMILANGIRDRFKK